MVYSHLAAYFLVLFLIQNGVSQRISIWGDPTTVSQGEQFAVTCQTVYAQFSFRRNNDQIIFVSYGKCNIPKDKTEKYKCESHKSRHIYTIKLKVLNGESGRWSCVYHQDVRMDSTELNIVVKDPDPPARPTPQKTTSTHRYQTSYPTQWTRHSSSRTPPLPSSPTNPRTSSSSSSKDPRKPKKLPTTHAPVDHPPVSTRSPSSSSSRASSSSTASSSSKGPRTPRKLPSTNAPVGRPPVSTPRSTNKPTIMIIAICCAVGVLVLLIIIFSVMILHDKRKQKRAKRGSVRPLTERPSRSTANGLYDVVDGPSPPKNIFGDDTAESVATPANTNPNFDASRVYGVVNKINYVADAKDSHGEDEAGASNPNFDPDKVYGVVNKSAKCQNPVFESTTENIYVNQ